MSLDNIFYIHSELLPLVEPLLQQYYDYDSSMLIDEMRATVENNGVNYITIENGELTANFQKAFYENKSLAILNPNYPYKDIADAYPEYFDFENGDIEAIREDYKVYLCLSYMGYIYYKEKSGLFDESCLITDLGLEQEVVLHKKSIQKYFPYTS